MKKPLTREQFISDVVRFCNRHLIAPSELGATIFNDRAFFGRLRKGISPRLEKVEIVYDYMIAFEAKEAEDKLGSGSHGADAFMKNKNDTLQNTKLPILKISK